MDCQLQTFSPLETIEEELEQEDQGRQSHTRDEEHKDFQIPVGVEAELAVTQSENEEDEGEFRVMRARRLHSYQESSSSGESHSNRCPPLQVRLSQYEDIPQHPQNAHTNSEGKKKRSRTYQKSTNGKLRKKATSKHEPFPKWLEDLMFNIEEATTHQLVVG